MDALTKKSLAEAGRRKLEEFRKAKQQAAKKPENAVDARAVGGLEASAVAGHSTDHDKPCSTASMQHQPAATAVPQHMFSHATTNETDMPGTAQTSAASIPTQAFTHAENSWNHPSSSNSPLGNLGHDNPSSTPLLPHSTMEEPPAPYLYTHPITTNPAPAAPFTLTSSYEPTATTTTRPYQDLAATESPPSYAADYHQASAPTFAAAQWTQPYVPPPHHDPTHMFGMHSTVQTVGNIANGSSYWPEAPHTQHPYAEVPAAAAAAAGATWPAAAHQPDMQAGASNSLAATFPVQALPWPQPLPDPPSFPGALHAADPQPAPAAEEHYAPVPVPLLQSSLADAFGAAAADSPRSTQFWEQGAQAPAAQAGLSLPAEAPAAPTTELHLPTEAAAGDVALHEATGAGYGNAPSSSWLATPPPAAAEPWAAHSFPAAAVGSGAIPGQDVVQYNGQYNGQYAGQYTGQHAEQYSGHKTQYSGEQAGQYTGQYAGQDTGKYTEQEQYAAGQYSGQDMSQYHGQYTEQYTGQEQYQYQAADAVQPLAPDHASPEAPDDQADARPNGDLTPEPPVSTSQPAWSSTPDSSYWTPPPSREPEQQQQQQQQQAAAKSGGGGRFSWLFGGGKAGRPREELGAAGEEHDGAAADGYLGASAQAGEQAAQEGQQGQAAVDVGGSGAEDQRPPTPLQSEQQQLQPPSGGLPGFGAPPPHAAAWQRGAEADADAAAAAAWPYHADVAVQPASSPADAAAVSSAPWVPGADAGLGSSHPYQLQEERPSSRLGLEEPAVAPALASASDKAWSYGEQQQQRSYEPVASSYPRPNDHTANGNGNGGTLHSELSFGVSAGLGYEYRHSPPAPPSTLPVSEPTALPGVAPLLPSAASSISSNLQGFNQAPELPSWARPTLSKDFDSASVKPFLPGPSSYTAPSSYAAAAAASSRPGGAYAYAADSTSTRLELSFLESYLDNLLRLDDGKGAEQKQGLGGEGAGLSRRVSSNGNGNGNDSRRVSSSGEAVFREEGADEGQKAGPRGDGEDAAPAAEPHDPEGAPRGKGEAWGAEAAGPGSRFTGGGLPPRAPVGAAHRRQESGDSVTSHDINGSTRSGAHQFSLLQQHIDELTEEKLGLQRGLAQQQRMAEGLAEENEALTGQYNVQAQAMDALQKKIQRYEDELEAQVLALEGLASERESARSLAQDTAQRLGSVAAEVVALEQALMEEKSARLRSEEAGRAAAAAAARAEKRLAALQREAAAAAAELERLAAEKRGLVVKLMQSEAKLARAEEQQRSSGSAAGHEAPAAAAPAPAPPPPLPLLLCVDQEVQCDLLQPGPEGVSTAAAAAAQAAAVPLGPHGHGPAAGTAAAPVNQAVETLGASLNQLTVYGGPHSEDAHAVDGASAAPDSPMRDEPSAVLAERALSALGSPSRSKGGADPLALLSRWLPHGPISGSSPVSAVVEEEVRAVHSVHELLEEYESVFRELVMELEQARVDNMHVLQSNQQLRSQLLSMHGDMGSQGQEEQPGPRQSWREEPSVERLMGQQDRPGESFSAAAAAAVSLPQAVAAQTSEGGMSMDSAARRIPGMPSPGHVAPAWGDAGHSKRTQGGFSGGGFVGSDASDDGLGGAGRPAYGRDEGPSSPDASAQASWAAMRDAALSTPPPSQLSYAVMPGALPGLPSSRQQQQQQQQRRGWMGFLFRGGGKKRVREALM